MVMVMAMMMVLVLLMVMLMLTMVMVFVVGMMIRLLIGTVKVISFTVVMIPRDSRKLSHGVGDGVMQQHHGQHGV